MTMHGPEGDELLGVSRWYSVSLSLRMRRFRLCWAGHIGALKRRLCLWTQNRASRL